MTTIDLGSCEDKLKEEYNISINDSLYILKIDYFIENKLKIEYEVYYNFSSNNLTKLNLTVCKGIKIDISIPKDIPIDELDKYNKSSGFYNDICYTLTTSSGTDETLKDRQNDYKNNNLSICEEDCDFTKYNQETKKVICSCDTKIELPIISNVKVDKNKLFSNFKDIRNIGNFEMLSCIELLFNLHNILNNSANYMLLVLFILSIISIFIFRFYDYKRIQKWLKKEKKNFYYKYYYYEDKNKNIKQTINNEKSNKESKNELISVLNNKQKGDKIIMRRIKIKNQKIKKKKCKKNKTTKRKQNHKKNEKLNDYELNELEYKDALKIDKRTFLQLYISLLKTNHILLFTFFHLNDYNSYMIKIYIFFLTFSMNYVVSAMFYSDSTMHKIYVDDGLFNFTYQLPQMVYSFIISTIIENLINQLGLYEKVIVEFKQNIKFIKNIKKILSKIKLKIILFFIISYILIFFYWIYLGCFCAVYKNTQIHLLLDVLSSFAISFLIGIVYNIFPCIFRILSLKDKKGNKSLLFKFSNIIQII